ncbi:hypothetical protein NRB20_75430 [Nocardia sp. RB20]|uniref:Uncharacterized protein n=1 Tax=Nocardia macrotermitis TaxID=2585198 RepID=A0A7K0DFF2_9NOCA|nr:hypothetical protein [Nocardia macrotermitis]
MIFWSPFGVGLTNVIWVPPVILPFSILPWIISSAVESNPIRLRSCSSLRTLFKRWVSVASCVNLSSMPGVSTSGGTNPWLRRVCSSEVNIVGGTLTWSGVVVRPRSVRCSSSAGR